MQAITLQGFGGVEVLSLSDYPMPTPAAEQVLVKVHAIGVNRADVLQRRGLYPPPAGDSELMGLEIAGEVIAIGSAVVGIETGQRVFGLVGGGGYAEYVLMDYQMAMPIPDDWSYAYAAAIPEVFMTANETIFELGRLQAGESILIHAGGSGVGTAATQMAHHAGATVYVTAGSAEKIERAISLGASAGINYHTQDFAEEVMRLTEGAGVDVVEDFIGASYLASNIKVLKTGGRLLIVALMGGHLAELKLSTVLSKRLQIIGSVMRARSLADKRAITQRFVNRWLPLLRQGEIKPIIDRQFALSEAAAAHEYMEANQNFGKILLVVGAD